MLPKVQNRAVSSPIDTTPGAPPNTPVSTPAGGQGGGGIGGASHWPFFRRRRRSAAPLEFLADAAVSTACGDGVDVRESCANTPDVEDRHQRPTGQDGACLAESGASA